MTVEEFEVELDTELQACYADPLRYVLMMWPWGDVGALEHDTGPEPWQRAFLEDLGQAVRDRAFDGHTPVMPIQMAVASGHGVGKSALGAWIVHWAMDTRPECKAKVTANTQTQLETSTWAAIQSWGATKLTADRWNCNSAALYVPEDRPNWFCVPTSCKKENSQAFAGLHNRRSTTLYLFDESSTIPDEVIEVAMGGLTDGEPMIFTFGNPTRRSGQLYRAVFGSERDLWNHRVINGEACEHSNKALYQQWRTIYGPDSDFVRVRVLGLPPNADELQYIDHARVEVARARVGVALPDEPLVAGFDVSGGGSAWNVIRFRRGLCGDTRPPIRLAGTLDADRSQRVGICAELLRDQRPESRLAALFVDAAYGAAIVVRLRALGFENVFEVNFGGASPDAHQLNMRAYMWAKAKEWLLLGALPDEDALCEQLELPGYHLNQAGKLVIEAKADIQARGEASPDDADAFCLTFAQPVAIPPAGRQTPAPAPPSPWG